MKGQITPINLMISFMVVVMFMFLLPVITDISDTVVTELELSPNTMTTVIVLVIRLIPFFILLAIIISILGIANPQREGR
jgi:type II secretory pathway component PulF